MVEWKVGHKYRCGVGATICTCIGFTTKNVPVVEYENIGCGVAVIQTPNNRSWEEYKEPLKGEFWINIYQDGSICKHSIKEAAHKASGFGRVACVRVPWAEGEGL